MLERLRQRRAQVLHLEYDFLPRGVRLRRETVRHIAADHAADNQVRCQLACRPGANIGAVSHDRHFVRDLQDLFHLVRDVNDGAAFCLQLTDNLEQVLCLVVRQRRRRFVHDDDLRIVANCLRNLHQLQVGCRQRARQHLRINIQIDLFEQLLRLLDHRLFIDGDPFHGESSQPDVLHYRTVTDRMQLLVDHGNAEVQRLFRRIDDLFLPIQDDFAAILVVDAEQTLHQSRFSRAVFAHQGMYAAGTHF